MQYVPLSYLARQAALRSKLKIIPAADVTDDHHHGALQAQDEAVHALQARCLVCVAAVDFTARWVANEYNFPLEGAAISLLLWLWLLLLL